MIYIAGDKHGFKAIKILEDYLKSHKLEYENLGVKSDSEDMKLEDIIPKVAKKVLKSTKNEGILSCGTGVGVDVGANKFGGIRSCLVTNEKFAEWARVYDNCNVLCLSGWEVDQKNLYKILDSWFKAKYDGNRDRLRMFEEFNKWH